MNKDDGGPAFPVADVFDERRGETMQYGSTGMSLRDYFAAKIMATFMAGSSLAPGLDAAEQLAFVAARAYETADALLAARAT